MKRSYWQRIRKRLGLSPRPATPPCPRHLETYLLITAAVPWPFLSMAVLFHVNVITLPFSVLSNRNICEFILALMFLGFLSYTIVATVLASNAIDMLEETKEKKSARVVVTLTFIIFGAAICGMILQALLSRQPFPIYEPLLVLISAALLGLRFLVYKSRVAREKRKMREPRDRRTTERKQA